MAMEVILKLPINLPDFYKECPDAWSELNATRATSYEDIVNQIIWNNKQILIKKQVMLY